MRPGQDVVPHRLAAACALALVLAACANPRGIESGGTMLDPARLGVGASSGRPAVQWPSDQWWTAYRDPSLDALVGRALESGTTRDSIRARVDRALAQSGIADSAGGLHVDAGIDTTRQRFPGHGLVPPPYAGHWYWVDNAQLTGRYEFDFWGRHRSALQAALGRVQVAQAEGASMERVLVTSVVRAWFNLAALLDARDIARLSLRQREESLRLVQQRVQAGLDDNVTLKQASSLVPAARQQIEAIDERIELTRNALAALAAAPRTDPAIAKVRPKLPAFRAGLAGVDPDAIPVDLIGRRPEIVAARERVLATQSDVSAARADFYPNVSIGAFAGFSSVGLSHLLRADSRVMGIAPAVRLPIFDNGRLRASLRATTAELDASIASYNQSLIDAVRDVADQAVSLRSIGRQIEQQRQSQQQAEAAYDLARQRYKAGLSPYLTVLTAETSVIDQRRIAADLRARAIDLDVQMQRALGGGYLDAKLPAASTAAAPASAAANPAPAATPAQGAAPRPAAAPSAASTAASSAAPTSTAVSTPTAATAPARRTRASRHHE